MEALPLKQTPKTLFRRRAQAQRDEVEHAILAAGLSSRFAGAPVELAPADTAWRAPVGGREGLRRLAIESWLDGCLEEGMAAQAAVEQASGAQDVSVRAALQQIAEDETQHAELAWDVLTWALGKGGTDVADAIRAARQSSNRSAFEDHNGEIAFWQLDTLNQANERLDRLLARA